MNPTRRRGCTENVRAHLHVSERRTLCALGQHRSMQRKLLRGREDGEQLMADVIALAGQLAATAIARLQLCCAGRSPTEGSNASWVECAAQTAQTRAPLGALMDRGDR